MHGEILTPPPMCDLTLLPINDIYFHVVLPAPEDRLNISLLSLEDIVSSPLLLTNN